MKKNNLFMSYEIIDKQVLNYITRYINPFSSRAIIMDSNSDFDLLNDNSHRLIINLADINTIESVNLYFENVSNRLTNNGIFVGVFKTDGKISLTEVLGRLVFAGYNVMDYSVINGRTCFIATKKSIKHDGQPVNGIFIKLKRLGKDGKTIDVYKLRTMYPYSEFLQEYIYKKNKLDTSGKFKNDFRVTKIGKFMRKFWIDELPMLFNILKGDLKLVGVRPLSFHYFSLYDNELQRMRLMVKPGLLPPFYADMPKSLEEIMESEKKYLTSYINNPRKTDIRYFFKILHNILNKKARSG